MTQVLERPQQRTVTPDFGLVLAHAEDDRVLFCMEQKAGELALAGLGLNGHPHPDRVVRKGFGSLVLNGQVYDEGFMTARLSKGRQLFNAIEAVRGAHNLSDPMGREAVILKGSMAVIAHLLVDYEPALKEEIRGRWQTFKYDKTDPLGLWKSQEVVNYLSEAHHEIKDPEHQISHAELLNRDFLPEEAA
jgi:hypothetical protein